jgi:hypothetical protein
LSTPSSRPTLREVAALVGITERTVQRIVADLEAGQYLERVRTGRRNRYKVYHDLLLRHPIEADRDIGALIELVTDPRARNVEPACLSAIATATRDQSSVPAESWQPAPDPVLETGSGAES